MDPIALILFVLGGYLLGSVPFGLLLTRAAGQGDIRKVGSGNIGATNVLRTGNKGLALLTLLLDGGKGAVAVLLAARYGVEASLIAGAGAFLGHLYPVWLKFRGGKGVATFFGIWLTVSWPVGLLCLASWLGAVALSRISAVGGLTAAILAPALAAWFVGLNGFALGLFMAVLILLRHRENIARLIDGTESKISKK